MWDKVVQKLWDDAVASVGSLEHLKAMGALALYYNELEQSLSIFIEHYMPGQRPASEYLFGNLTNNHRTNLIRKFLEREPDTSFCESLSYGITNFDICAENRNLLLHALPSGQVGDETVLDVLKSPRGNPHVMNRYHFKLEDIRASVVGVQQTADYLTRLYLFISRYESDGQVVVTTLPERPLRPRKLSLSQLVEGPRIDPSPPAASGG